MSNRNYVPPSNNYNTIEFIKIVEQKPQLKKNKIVEQKVIYQHPIQFHLSDLLPVNNSGTDITLSTGSTLINNNRTVYPSITISNTNNQITLATFSKLPKMYLFYAYIDVECLVSHIQFNSLQFTLSSNTIPTSNTLQQTFSAPPPIIVAEESSFCSVNISDTNNKNTNKRQYNMSGLIQNTDNEISLVLTLSTKISINYNNYHGITTTNNFPNDNLQYYINNPITQETFSFCYYTISYTLVELN
jgi:hypothetical protein